MKILICYKSLALGGQQTQLLNLARQFKKCGHDVAWLYETPGQMRDVVGKEATLYRFQSGTEYSATQYLMSCLPRFLRPATCLAERRFKYRKIIKQLNPELILVSDSYTSFVVGKLRGNRRVFRMIGQDIERLEMPWFGYYRLLKIDRGIQKYFGWDVPYLSLQTIGVSPQKLVNFQAHAVDTDTYIPLSGDLRCAAREKFGFLRSDLVIGWVGRLEERMQVEATIMLVSRLFEIGLSDVKLLIVGGGLVDNRGKEDQVYPSKLRNLISEKGLEEQVVLTGWVEQEKMPSLINAMDVVPLLEEDPQGGSILREAMSCGRVAMTVDGPSGAQRGIALGNHAILLGGENYSEQAVAEVVALHENRERLESIGKAARVFAEAHLSCSTQATQILDEAGVMQPQCP